MKKAAFIVILTSLLLLTSSFVGAATVAWNWPSTGNWAWDYWGYWSPNRVPAPEDDVVVNLSGIYTILVDKVDVTIDSLTLGPTVFANTLILSSGMFTIKSDCINDPSTGLCWDRTDSGVVMMYADAELYCSGKGARLPTIYEGVIFATEGAATFTWSEDYTSIGYLPVSTADLRPRLAARGYLYTVNTWLAYWSSTNGQYGSNNGWVVRFDNASVYVIDKGAGVYTRCVRF